MIIFEYFSYQLCEGENFLITPHKATFFQKEMILSKCGMRTNHAIVFALSKKISNVTDDEMGPMISTLKMYQI
jgi:hypothetical protein